MTREHFALIHPHELENKYTESSVSYDYLGILVDGVKKSREILIQNEKILHTVELFLIHFQTSPDNNLEHIPPSNISSVHLPNTQTFITLETAATRTSSTQAFLTRSPKI